MIQYDLLPIKAARDWLPRDKCVTRQPITGWLYGTLTPSVRVVLFQFAVDKLRCACIPVLYVTEQKAEF